MYRFASNAMSAFLYKYLSNMTDTLTAGSEAEMSVQNCSGWNKSARTLRELK